MSTAAEQQVTSEQHSEVVTIPKEGDRFAAIDIGSNSVRIVVAQATVGGYRVLDEERENTRLAALRSPKLVR